MINIDQNVQFEKYNHKLRNCVNDVSAVYNKSEKISNLIQTSFLSKGRRISYDILLHRLVYTSSKLAIGSHDQ